LRKSQNYQYKAQKQRHNKIIFRVSKICFLRFVAVNFGLLLIFDKVLWVMVVFFLIDELWLTFYKIMFVRVAKPNI